MCLVMLTRALLVLATCLSVVEGFPGLILNYDAGTHLRQESGVPGKAVTGEYRWLSADGRENVVRYTADENGYVARGNIVPGNYEPLGEPKLLQDENTPNEEPSSETPAQEATENEIPLMDVNDVDGSSIDAPANDVDGLSAEMATPDAPHMKTESGEPLPDDKENAIVEDSMNAVQFPVTSDNETLPVQKDESPTSSTTDHESEKPIDDDMNAIVFEENDIDASSSIDNGISFIVNPPTTLPQGYIIDTPKNGLSTNLLSPAEDIADTKTDMDESVSDNNEQEPTIPSVMSDDTPNTDGPTLSEDAIFTTMTSTLKVEHSVPEYELSTTETSIVVTEDPISEVTESSLFLEAGNSITTEYPTESPLVPVEYVSEQIVTTELAISIEETENGGSDVSSVLPVDMVTEKEGITELSAGHSDSGLGVTEIIEPSESLSTDVPKTVEIPELSSTYAPDLAEPAESLSTDIPASKESTESSLSTVSDTESPSLQKEDEVEEASTTETLISIVESDEAVTEAQVLSESPSIMVEDDIAGVEVVYNEHFTTKTPNEETSTFPITSAPSGYVYDTPENGLFLNLLSPTEKSTEDNKPDEEDGVEEASTTETSISIVESEEAITEAQVVSESPSIVVEDDIVGDEVVYNEHFTTETPNEETSTFPITSAPSGYVYDTPENGLFLNLLSPTEKSTEDNKPDEEDGVEEASTTETSISIVESEEAITEAQVVSESPSIVVEDDIVGDEVVYNEHFTTETPNEETSTFPITSAPSGYVYDTPENGLFLNLLSPTEKSTEGMKQDEENEVDEASTTETLISIVESDETVTEAQVVSESPSIVVEDDIVGDEVVYNEHFTTETPNEETSTFPITSAPSGYVYDTPENGLFLNLLSPTEKSTEGMKQDEENEVDEASTTETLISIVESDETVTEAQVVSESPSIVVEDDIAGVEVVDNEYFTTETPTDETSTFPVTSAPSGYVYDTPENGLFVNLLSPTEKSTENIKQEEENEVDEASTTETSISIVESDETTAEAQEVSESPSIMVEDDIAGVDVVDNEYFTTEAPSGETSPFPVTSAPSGYVYDTPENGLFINLLSPTESSTEDIKPGEEDKIEEASTTETVISILESNETVTEAQVESESPSTMVENDLAGVEVVYNEYFTTETQSEETSPFPVTSAPSGYVYDTPENGLFINFPQGNRMTRPSTVSVVTEFEEASTTEMPLIEVETFMEETSITTVNPNSPTSEEAVTEIPTVITDITEESDVDEAVTSPSAATEEIGITDALVLIDETTNEKDAISESFFESMTEETVLATTTETSVEETVTLDPAGSESEDDEIADIDSSLSEGTSDITGSGTEIPLETAPSSTVSTVTPIEDATEASASSPTEAAASSLTDDPTTLDGIRNSMTSGQNETEESPSEEEQEESLIEDQEQSFPVEDQETSSVEDQEVSPVENQQDTPPVDNEEEKLDFGILKAIFNAIFPTTTTTTEKPAVQEKPLFQLPPHFHHANHHHFVHHHGSPAHPHVPPTHHHPYRPFFKYYPGMPRPGEKKPPKGLIFQFIH